MRILLIGGYGTIGKRVHEALKSNHEVLIAGRSRGDVKVDLANSDSVRKMYKNVGKVDAVICLAGEAKWDYMDQLSEEDFYIGIKSKLMGQVNLVKIGTEMLDKGTSFTLTSGILAERPVLMTTSAAMVNGALHSFVLAAGLEMKKDQRVNIVCAGLVEDSAEKYADYFPGHEPVSMKRVCNAYLASILGDMNGEILRVY